MRKTTFPAVLSTFLVCFAFWLLLTWKVSVQELIAGAVVSLLTALFAGRFFIHEKAGWFFNPVKLFIGLFYWIFVFPIELIKANCSMAGLVLGGCKRSIRASSRSRWISRATTAGLPWLTPSP